MTTNSHPKRLIEVDLPIGRISAHARREKSIRHGHISTLHIWWARRPLAACRAVICAALWPDPADTHCPPSFREAAKQAMRNWAQHHLNAGTESFPRFDAIQKDPARLDDLVELRWALLDFIADFANWDNATLKPYLDTSRALTQSAHEALGGTPGTRPLVVDPFAGGGSIPLEALRVGADAFASDLNPIAVLLNKVVLEYIPKYGQRLADAVRQWGARIIGEAEKELAAFYPKDPDGATPIAYLWARTIQCEGPGCGAEVPLVRGLWLSKKAGRMTALKIVPHSREKRVEFEIVANVKAAEVGHGTVRRGAATCPCCGFTTPVTSVQRQLKEKHGGADDARLLTVVTTRPGQTGRFIHAWMPRLAEEGVVGADAIFTCLGPALEIFSRCARVEKASGEVVSLREYLEQVWAAVAKEALAQVFKDADTAGFEPDARLTAMWLWTLNAGASNGDGAPADEEEADDEEKTQGKAGRAKGGFALEYDAARKIAQGLGAHLEEIGHVVEIAGDTARLLPVSERTAYLFGKKQADAPTGGQKKKAAQMDLFGELTKVGADETAWSEKTVKKLGETTLDRVHQAMILFAAGRGEALKRFLVEDGAGKDQRFWRLAQALSASIRHHPARSAGWMACWRARRAWGCEMVDGLAACFRETFFAVVAGRRAGGPRETRRRDAAGGGVAQRIGDVSVRLLRLVAAGHEYGKI